MAMHGELPFSISLNLHFSHVFKIELSIKTYFYTFVNKDSRRVQSMMMMMQDPSRTIVISSEINSMVAKEVIERIHEINENDDHREETEVKFDRMNHPIKVIVNTPGGYVLDGFAIAGAITTSVTPVITICLGHAMSMGFLIFAAGHQRVVHPLSMLMYHEISTGVWGKISEIKTDIKVTEKMQEMYDKFILERTKITEKQLEDAKTSGKDWYLTPDDAIKMGVADHIVEFESVIQQASQSK
jgi:ATP-dependent Clp protease protease subunit